MKSYFAKRSIFYGKCSVKFLSHPEVETRISHTAKNRNCAVSIVKTVLVDFNLDKAKNDKDS